MGIWITTVLSMCHKQLEANFITNLRLFGYNYIMLHSSPLKPGGQVYAPQLRADVQSFAVPDGLESLSLADFWKELDYRPED